MVFDWQYVEAKELGIKNCPFCDGPCVISQIGNEHTKKLCFEIKCTKCYVARKQCLLNGRGHITKDRLKEMMIVEWNKRQALPLALDLIEECEAALSAQDKSWSELFPNGPDHVDEIVNPGDECRELWRGIRAALAKIEAFERTVENG